MVTALYIGESSPLPPVTLTDTCTNSLCSFSSVLCHMCFAFAMSFISYKKFLFFFESLMVKIFPLNYNPRISFVYENMPSNSFNFFYEIGSSLQCPVTFVGGNRALMSYNIACAAKC